MTFWTAEREVELRAHFAAGLTGGQIAFRMGGISRNVIIGKLHRLGLNRGFRPGPRRLQRLALPVKAPAPMRPKAPPPPADAPPAAPPQPCGLLELTNERCRWPIAGDIPPFTFCGALDANLRDGRPYCAAHSRMAYNKREAA